MAEIPNTYIVKKSQVDDIPNKEGTIYTSDTNDAERNRSNTVEES